MGRDIITITKCGTVILPDVPNKSVWMSEMELVELFGVIAPTLRSAVRAVYKSGVLKEYEVQKYVRLENGYYADVFGFPMIAALAFRINAFGAEQVRNAILERLYLRKEKTSISFSLNVSGIAAPKVSGMNICNDCIYGRFKSSCTNLLPIKRITDKAYCC